MRPVAGVLWKSSLLSGSTLWTMTTVNKPVIGELGWATKRFSSHIWLQRMPLLKRQWSFYLLLCPWLHPQVWVQWMNRWIVFLGNNIWGGLHVRAQRQPLMTETAILNLVPRHPLIIPWPWYLGFQDSMRPPILPLCAPRLDLIRTEVLLRPFHGHPLQLWSYFQGTVFHRWFISCSVGLTI